MSPLRLLRVLRFELEKALRSRLSWVLLGLPALLTVISVWISEIVRRTEQLGQGQLEGITSAYAPFSRGASNGFVLGGILLLFHASMLMANEGSLRTFKTTLLRPHTRLEMLGAKLGLLLLLALALLLVVVSSGLAAAAWASDYAAIAEEGYTIYDAQVMLRETVRAIVLVLPALAALAAFGLMVSTLSDHPGIAASGCIGAYIFLEALKGSLSDARLYLFNSFMPSLVDTSYFAVLRGFADGLSDAGWDETWIVYNVATPLVSALIFTAVGAWSFTRRDVLV